MFCYVSTHLMQDCEEQSELLAGKPLVLPPVGDSLQKNLTLILI